MKMSMERFKKSWTLCSYLVAPKIVVISPLSYILGDILYIVHILSKLHKKYRVVTTGRIIYKIGHSGASTIHKSIHKMLWSFEGEDFNLPLHQFIHVSQCQEKQVGSRKRH